MISGESVKVVEGLGGKGDRPGERVTRPRRR